MFLYKAVCTVLMDLFYRYDDKIIQYIAIYLIVMVRPCLATGMMNEEKADS